MCKTSSLTSPASLQSVTAKRIPPCPFDGCEFGSSQCERQNLNCTDCDIRPRILQSKISVRRSHAGTRACTRPTCKFLLGEAHAGPLTTAPESLKCQLLDAQICRSETFVCIFGKATPTYPFSDPSPAARSQREERPAGSISFLLSPNSLPASDFYFPFPAKISRPTNSLR